jgi:hypothetical protein
MVAPDQRRRSEWAASEHQRHARTTANWPFQSGRIAHASEFSTGRPEFFQPCKSGLVAELNNGGECMNSGSPRGVDVRQRLGEEEGQAKLRFWKKMKYTIFLIRGTPAWLGT